MFFALFSVVAVRLWCVVVDDDDHDAYFAAGLQLLLYHVTDTLPLRCPIHSANDHDDDDEDDNNDDDDEDY